MFVLLKQPDSLISVLFWALNRRVHEKAVSVFEEFLVILLPSTFQMTFAFEESTQRPGMTCHNCDSTGVERSDSGPGWWICHLSNGFFRARGWTAGTAAA